MLAGGIAAVALAALASGTAPSGERQCVPRGAWVVPGSHAGLAAAEVVERAARQSVVLLGERHDSAEHHRWQLQTIAALHARTPGLALGFEMFPGRVQPVLDRWVAGELTEQEFLAAADWRRVWSFDPQLYLPLFHFARMNRIPILALNVERELTRLVSEQGFEAVPGDQREGVTRPAPPLSAYLDTLLPVWVEHLPAGRRDKAGRDDPAFQRFVDSQQVWDRAMAQRIAAAVAREPRPLVVGVMGSGHIVHGHGVPHQLRDLGITRVMALLPWDQGGDCGGLTAGLADAVFGVVEPRVAAAPRPRLGVRIEAAADGVRIVAVEKGGVAEASGLREADLIREVAGLAARQPADVVAAVQRQAPGTWLPLAVTRGGERLEIVARFPPRPERD